jgi:hypothetical protein
MDREYGGEIGRPDDTRDSTLVVCKEWRLTADFCAFSKWKRNQPRPGLHCETPFLLAYGWRACCRERSFRLRT